MTFSSNTMEWATATFGSAQLGDARRTARLATLAASAAKHQGKSIVTACQDSASTIAAYRLLNNEKVTPSAIADSGFAYTAELLRQHNNVLAIEDTTALAFKHPSVRDKVGYTTSHIGSRGMLAHSVLLYCPEDEHVVGLIDQHIWNRPLSDYGKGKEKAGRPYEEKESFKWQRSSQVIAGRLGEQMNKVISVCDREADVFEYLTYKIKQKQRFIVRAAQNRRLLDSKHGLFALAETLQPAGSHQVKVEQRAGRKARTAVLTLSYAKITLREPKHKTGTPIELYYVCCQEVGGDGLCWHLLTSEVVDSAEGARRIVQYYERRWLIEDFHKAWKSGGTQVEKLKLQSSESLERMSTILAFIAVRILQLRQIGIQGKKDTNRSSEEVLSPLEWKLLWLKTEEAALPASPPNLYWVYFALAKLARWYDSKRTGRVGWPKLWEGWYMLQTLVENYHFLNSLKQNEL